MAAGRLAPANMFATLPVLNNYLNQGASTLSPGPWHQRPRIRRRALPAWNGVLNAMYRVTRTLEVSAGVYNTNAKAAAGSDHGVQLRPPAGQ